MKGKSQGKSRNKIAKVGAGEQGKAEFMCRKGIGDSAEILVERSQKVTEEDKKIK